MKLTSEQQKTILNSMWVVNTVLKELGESGNQDLKQFAVLSLCECLNNFDASKGTKWTTYAYSTLLYKLKRERQRELKHNVCVNIDNFYTLSTETDEEQVYAKETVNKIKDLCNDRELLIVELTMQGYSRKAISKQLGVSHTTIDKAWHNLKAKIIAKIK